MESNLLKSLLQRPKRLIASLMAGDITASLAKLIQLHGVSRTFEFDRRSDDLDEFVVAHFVRGEANDFHVVWEQTSLLL